MTRIIVTQLSTDVPRETHEECELVVGPDTVSVYTLLGQEHVTSHIGEDDVFVQVAPEEDIQAVLDKISKLFDITIPAPSSSPAGHESLRTDAALHAES